MFNSNVERAVQRALRVAGALLAVVAVVGCSTAMGKATEPDAFRPDPPTLLGTWQASEVHPEDASGTVVFTLTFTVDRWVLVITSYDMAGAVFARDARTGSWRQTETTIEQSFYHRDDENDQPGRVLETVAKTYTLTDSTLTVERWIDDDTGSPQKAMSRITDAAILAPPAGSWVLDWVFY